MVHILVRMTMMMKMMAVIPSSIIIPKSKTTVRIIIVKIVAPTIKIKLNINLNMPKFGIR